MAKDWGTYRSGMRDILSSPEVAAEMAKAAEAMAERVHAEGRRVEHGEVSLPVKVEVTSGEFGARASVILAHPAGINVEAKYGLLGRSAP